MKSEIVDFRKDSDGSTNENSKYDFKKTILESHVDVEPLAVETLQLNITKLCNQACLHCHVDASPKRTEQMDLETIDRCLEILAGNNGIKNVDITGGAPELNPHFDYLVRESITLGKHVMSRHNLTVTLDGNPASGESKAYLPQFYAENNVELISSLPYHQEYFTDKQRGRGVFEKSLKSLQLLNEQGYGKDDSNLKLNLVYNPAGAFLPACQASLEQDFKKSLLDKYGIYFNNLFVITNMPIHRFKEQLQRRGGYEDYLEKLVNAYNPIAAAGIMCRSLVSVSYDGRIFDCDFNQMLDMQIDNGELCTVYNFNYNKLMQRQIRFATHCFGCTAGAGSSCGGETA
ncbi:MAG: arsenosugar biosynthesis radical SAM protein ArsS [Deferribacteres bacterium]|nr:arsenosugar biosynthesis radical SAM protein ArsS [candidate division KSB1 bacterium]MCB9503925.1 arsenosugar biosynthesis radical SAM protein ArsS [Deferribacteres bacterium]